MTWTTTGATTKRAVLAEFVRHASPRILVTAALFAVVARIVVGRFGLADAFVAAVTVALVGPVEWVIHRFLLHAPTESWRMRTLGTGTGHREHHLDPAAVGWILLAGADAAVFVVVIAAFTAVWSVPALWLAGLPVAAGYSTALALAYSSLAHYEWTHLLVHTAYRPKSRFYRRLARNHRLHHYRNERYWLGVTSNLGDRVLRTLPPSKSAVPMSSTARSLDRAV